MKILQYYCRRRASAIIIIVDGTSRPAAAAAALRGRRAPHRTARTVDAALVRGGRVRRHNATRGSRAARTRTRDARRRGRRAPVRRPRSCGPGTRSADARFVRPASAVLKIRGNPVRGRPLPTNNRITGFPFSSLSFTCSSDIRFPLASRRPPVFPRTRLHFFSSVT